MDSETWYEDILVEVSRIHVMFYPDIRALPVLQSKPHHKRLTVKIKILQSHRWGRGYTHTNVPGCLLCVQRP